MIRAERSVGLYREAMIEELQKNTHKGDWTGRSNRAHFSDLDYHCDKLKAAVRSGAPAERILEFAADVGNHAMFIADDRDGALSVTFIERRKKEPEYVRPDAMFWLCMLLYPRSYWPALVAWLNPQRRGYKLTTEKKPLPY